MSESSEIRNKHVWLIELLSQRRTLKEIQEEWKTSDINHYPGTVPSRKTVYNWIQKIQEEYGIDIQVVPAGQYSYYQVVSRPGGDSIRKWLLGTVSVQNKLISNKSVRGRILLEDIPSSGEHLDTVLDAIKQNRLISFDYEDYWEDPVTVTMQPYFVKLYRQHWKVIGPLEEGKKKTIRSYALDADRMKNLKVLDRRFRYPKDFNPEDFMADSIGTATFPPKAAEPKDVIILAWEKINLYLKHTPLHGSQRILHDSPEDGYTIFAYRLHTTDDFYQEICRYGNYMEVLYPNDVRNEMMKIIKGMGDEYAGVSRRDCKKKGPGVKELKALMKGAEK
ncbi:MAG: WYL domain-containing protein [Candidatus Cryptobacteroides sp.]